MLKTNKMRNYIVLLIFTVFLSCTNKQEYILQYLDDNQELVTLVYDSVDSINSHTKYLDSIGVTYWVD